MIHYQVTMQHTERSLQALSHMQYDLFCQRNQISRTVISFGALIFGVINFQQWWGALLLLYGSYLSSSKYASANHTVKKLVSGIKASGLGFPQSRYLFRDNAMEVITMPENTALGEPILYSDIVRLGEDGEYFYIFPNPHGGYMIPKKELEDEGEGFRAFMEDKTEKSFQIHAAPIVKMMRKAAAKKRKSEKR